MYNIISIDPGNDNMGVSVWEYVPSTRERRLLSCFTLDGSRHLKKNDWMIGLYSDRAIKQMGLKDDLVWLFNRTNPHAVVCESNFLSRFPQAYAGLVEVVGCAIRQAIIEYRPFLGLHFIDPVTAKLAVGAAPKGGGKEDVKNHVGSLPLVVYALETPIANLEFDACDSIAIGYAWLNQLEAGEVIIGGL